MAKLRIEVLALAGSALLLMSGCQTVGTCKHPFTDATAPEIPPLKMPVGLDGPDTTQALKIPPLKEVEAPRAHGDPCLEEPPPMKEQGSQSPQVTDEPVGPQPGEKRTHPVSPPR